MLNTTTNDSLDVDLVKKSALGWSLMGIDILIIVLNMLALVVISRFKHKNAIDIYILSLSASDLLKGMIPVSITIYIYLSDWNLEIDSNWCDFYGWIAFTTNSGSMLILTLMSIERYLAIVKPFVHRAKVTIKSTKYSVIIAVIFSGAHSALPLVKVGRMFPYYNGAYCHFDYSNYSRGTSSYSIFVVSYGFAMNLVVFVCYVVVFYKMRNLIYRHRKMASQIRRKAKWNLKTEKMFSYLTVVLMVLFSFTWLPFLGVVLSAQLGLPIQFRELDLLCMRIAVVNSMLNPIAYATLCKPYRRGIIYFFRRCFNCCSHKNSNQDDWVLDPWARRSMSTNSERTQRDAPPQTNVNSIGEVNRCRLSSGLECNENKNWRLKHSISRLSKIARNMNEEDETSNSLKREIIRSPRSSVSTVSSSTDEEEKDYFDMPKKKHKKRYKWKTNFFTRKIESNKEKSRSENDLFERNMEIIRQTNIKRRNTHDYVKPLYKSESDISSDNENVPNDTMYASVKSVQTNNSEEENIALFIRKISNDCNQLTGYISNESSSKLSNTNLTEFLATINSDNDNSAEEHRCYSWTDENGICTTTMSCDEREVWLNVTHYMELKPIEDRCVKPLSGILYDDSYSSFDDNSSSNEMQ